MIIQKKLEKQNEEHTDLISLGECAETYPSLSHMDATPLHASYRVAAICFETEVVTPTISVCIVLKYFSSFAEVITEQFFVGNLKIV